MNFVKSLLVIVTVVLFASCNDTSTGDGGSGPGNFLLKIGVRNAQGNPVQGLRVSAWNMNLLLGPYQRYPETRPLKTTATSSIGFEVPKASRVTLTFLEMDETTYSIPVDHRVMNAGAYQFSFQVNQGLGTRVYKCRMVAQDSSNGNQLFADSVYLVLWQPDAYLSVLGTTSSTGEIVMTDSLRFPNVLSLPGLVRTGNDPTPLEIFSLPDSVMIVAMDTVAGKAQEFRHVVQKGTNEIQLVWNPTPSSGSIQPIGIDRRPTRLLRDSSTAPTKWKLHQNYPNPFN